MAQAERATEPMSECAIVVHVHHRGTRDAAAEEVAFILDAYLRTEGSSPLVSVDRVRAWAGGTTFDYSDKARAAMSTDGEGSNDGR